MRSRRKRMSRESGMRVYITSRGRLAIRVSSELQSVEQLYY